MRAEDHELVRLLAAAKLGDDVGSGDRAADCVRDGKVGIELLPGGQQARHASRILARDQHHGKAINFAVAGIGVAVEQIVWAGGLERNRQRLGLYRAIDDAGRLQIFGKEVVPCFASLRNAPEGCAPAMLPALAKSSSLPCADIHHPDVTM